MIDLFGLVQQPKRIHDKLKAVALVEVVRSLKNYPAVIWCEHMNLGACRWCVVRALWIPRLPGPSRKAHDGFLLDMEVRLRLTGRSKEQPCT